MKNVITIIMISLVTLSFTSCSGGDTNDEKGNSADICSCKKLRKEMSEKAKDAGTNKLADLKEHYKDQAEECKKLRKEMVKGLEGEELEVKKKEIMEEFEACK